MALEQVRPIARSYFEGDVPPAHDWHHVDRVHTLAARLATAPRRRHRGRWRAMTVRTRRVNAGVAGR